MTMGWHMVMEFTPSLVGCLISSGNHSCEMVSRSRECVINIPTVELARTVVKVGNCSGAQVDKFKAFKLTAFAGEQVKAPLIAECYASLTSKPPGTIEWECWVSPAWLWCKSLASDHSLSADRTSAPRSPERLARALDFGSDHAIHNVIVDQPQHEGIDRGRSDEFPALLLEGL